MKRTITVLCIAVLFSMTAGFSQYTFISDSLNNKQSFKDLSLLRADTSVFQLANSVAGDSLDFRALQLKPGAVGISQYGSGSIYAHTCIDYMQSMQRTKEDTLFIEFDVLWENLGSDGTSGRLDVFLLHEYDSADLTPDILNDDTKHYYGRPAYDLRLHNGTKGAGWVIGGGDHLDGEFNFTGNNNWLPGFLGPTPDGWTSQWEYNYTEEDMYPTNNKARWKGKTGGTTIVSTTNWKHFKWVITGEQMKLYHRKTYEPESAEQEYLTIQTPDTADGSFFEYYRYYDQFDGVRFYSRSGHQFSLANVNVRTSANPKIGFEGSQKEVTENDTVTFTLNVTKALYKFDAILKLQESSAYTLGHGKQDTTISIPAGVDKYSFDLVLKSDSAKSEQTQLILDSVMQGAKINTESDFMLLYVSPSNSIDQRLLKQFSIHPNPVQDQLHLSMGDGLNAAQSLEYTILTLQGQELLKGQFSGSERIDISDLSRGVYILRMGNQEAVTQRKFIKQ